MLSPRKILLALVILTGFQQLVAKKNSKNRKKYDDDDDDDGQPDYCPEPDGMFPNPNDCTSFYNCVGGTPVIQSCAPGLLFDPKTDMCNFPDQVKCSNECRGTDGLFPSQHRCDEFILCTGNKAEVKRCKKGLWFDANLQVCNYKSAVICTLPGGGKNKNKGNDDDDDDDKGSGKGGKGSKASKGSKGGNKGDKGGKGRNSGRGSKGDDDDEDEDEDEDYEDYDDSEESSKKSKGKSKGRVKVGKNPKHKPGIVYDSNNSDESSKQAHLELATASVRSVCPKARGLFPHSEDCNMFYQCYDGEVRLRSCPVGLLFEERAQECMYPRYVSCGNRRTPSLSNYN